MGVKVNEDGDSDRLFKSVVDQINLWYETTGAMSASLLGILSAGLIASYCVLIHTIYKYFKNQLQQEMKRLTILFATFIFAYVLRFFYQLALG